MPKNDEKRPVRCSFCGKHQEQVARIIAGPGAYICNECVQLCMSILDDDYTDPEQAGPDIPDVIPTPRRSATCWTSISSAGGRQSRLSVAVYNHYKRIYFGGRGGTWSCRRATSCSWGPTGCGKTLLAQTLARILKVPFAIADATTLTEAGLCGRRRGEHPPATGPGADFDIELAERGIIYIDEMDKIARKSENPPSPAMCPARACSRPC